MNSVARFAALLALMIGASTGVRAQSAISGTVWQIRSGKKLPLEGAFVVARLAGGHGIIARAETDSKGGYVLTGLPGKRLTVTASVKSYYVVVADGRERPEVQLECPARGDCSEIDFELSRGAVIEGYVRDEYDFPLPTARIQVFEGEGEQESALRTLMSDDLGYFRLWGLKPGPYRIEADMRRQPDFRADPVEVDVVSANSTETVYLDFRRTGQPRSVAGIVSGLRPAKGAMVLVQLVPKNYTSRRYSAQLDIETSTFRIEGAPDDDYLAFAMEINPTSGYVRPKRSMLGGLRVDGDMEGVELSVVDEAGIVAKIWLDGRVPDRPPRISMTRADGGLRAYLLRVEGAENSIEERDLFPGRYLLRTSASDFYVKEPRELTVEPGQVREIDIHLSTEFALVEGRVRPPGVYRVALAGAEKTESVETGDDGGFFFGRLIPGDYRVAAWADSEVDIKSGQAWEAAGELVREFPLSAGDQVELTLTAAGGP